MPTSGRPTSRRDPDDALVRLVLLGDAVVLKLEVDLLGAEDPEQLVGVGAGVVGAVTDQALAEPRLQAAGERDHALGMAVEQLHVDVRLAARESLQEARGAELHQVAEARVVGRQQGEVVALVANALADRLAVVDQVGLQPDDRLDPLLPAGLVEVDGAVHHPVVGEPERRHAELRRPLATIAARSCRRRRAASTRCGRADGRPGCSRRHVFSHGRWHSTAGLAQPARSE